MTDYFSNLKYGKEYTTFESRTKNKYKILKEIQQDLMKDGYTWAQARRKAREIFEDENIGENAFLNDMFGKLTEKYGDNSIFTNLDLDLNKEIGDEEIYNYTLLEDEKKGVIKENLDFIFEELDKDDDGILNEKELNKLNGGLHEDKNAEAIKSLLVLAGLEIEDKAKQKIQKNIDNIFAGMLKEEEQQPVQENQPIAAAPIGNSSGGGGGTDSANIKTVADYEAEINKKETEKETIKQKTQEEIQKYETQIEEALKESGVSEEDLNNYNIQKQEYDTQIQQQDAIIVEQNQLYQTNMAQVGGIESTIQAYQQQISNLEANKANTLGDSEAQTRISTKISNLQNEIANEEGNKAALIASAQEAQLKAQEAQEEKQKLEDEKDALLIKLEEEKNISDEVKQKIDSIKDLINTAKTNEQSKISAIDTEILALKTQKAKLESKEKSDAIIEQNKESSFDANGKRIGQRKYPQTKEEYAMYGLKSDDCIAAFEKCDQRLKDCYIDMSDWAREQGIYLQVNSSYRTRAQQEAIYANGTNPLGAAPGTSLHEKGLAIDIRPYDIETGKVSQSAYAKLGGYWQNVLGYEWLGDRNNNPEKWHFEIS